MKIIAEHATLLAGPNDAGPLCPARTASQVRRNWRPAEVRPLGANSFGALLGTIAVVLIALHAICAAMIVDRALARAPEPITVSPGD